jgi:hypothetical protein
LVCLAVLTGCDGLTSPPRFALLTPEETGITFANTIPTSDSINVKTEAFIYNGGGVAVGDIDNDGLADVFFTGNMVSSRLYANDGAMRFTDITETAGVTTDVWASGASLVDIDNNGYLDIYVSVSGFKWTDGEKRRNLLFLNNGDRTFTEAAAAYGIADTSFTTHAAFLDYDRDGWVDVFLLNNDPAGFSRGESTMHPAGLESRDPMSHDRLYRNNGDGTFTDVSAAAGILAKIGFGLGVAVTDLNRDGWPDIYVSNDLKPSDVLYINNGDGTFTDRAGSWLTHTSFAGMGVDIADYNNDGWFDILQTDMVPEDLQAQKRMTGAVEYQAFEDLRRRGFHLAYNANALQLNHGVTPTGDVVLSEIARLAGVVYTDWTWGPLFGDLDNDGYKDVLITNGYPKAVIDYDYQVTMYALSRDADDRRWLEVVNALHSYHVPNYVFHNNGDLTFADVTETWGMDQPSFSNGAALADLDNDGRLDIVVNNIDAPAFVYHNRPPVEEQYHYLQVRLEGAAPNPRGVGATLALVAGGKRQFAYHNPYRGYVSTVDDRIHFGLGDVERVDTLLVVWPDGRSQVIVDIPADRLVSVQQADAVDAVVTLISSTRPGPFRAPEPGTAPAYVHRSSGMVDFAEQPLLPHMLSRHGPPLAVGDVDNDGLEDVYVGGTDREAGTLMMQQAGGGFREANEGQPWEADKDFDHWGALFFDANGDGRLDLYVASGGYRLTPVSQRLQDRLYINQGDGRFLRDREALPPMPTSTARVVAGDFTGDGRTDLFVGGRLVPRSYPLPTRSYLLRNDGGRFTDVTDTWAPEVVTPGGMITDAVLVDFTGDGRLDLVTAGTWMAVEFHANEGARFRRVTDEVAPPGMRGWWYSLAVGDFNEDGHPDLVVGNLGLNHTFTTSADSRFGVYADDFTGNQTTDIVFTKEIDGTEYPYFGLARMGRGMFSVGARFATFEEYAETPIRDMFSASQLEGAVHYQVDTFASVYLQHDGRGAFTATSLPLRAQVAPITAMLAHDIDGDGHQDLLVAGNQFNTEPNVTRADAGTGLWLKGDGRGGFAPASVATSGFLARGQVAELGLVTTTTGLAVLVSNTDDSLQTFVFGDQ